LIALDLVLGGHGLSQPLLGGSAWDGERFYGLGNGYFAFALAAVMLVAGFAPLSAVATAALLAGLGVVDGLPRLGADVGGALTSMLTAAAALVVLAPGRPRGRRAGLLGAPAGGGGPRARAGRAAQPRRPVRRTAPSGPVRRRRHGRRPARPQPAPAGQQPLRLGGPAADPGRRPDRPAPAPALRGASRVDPAGAGPRRPRLVAADPAQRHRGHRHLGQRPVPARHPRLGLARPAPPPGQPACWGGPGDRTCGPPVARF